MDSTSSFEDRISHLSDSLIHHILSFIDMKYAVQTCVLSKRWSEIWISLPFLNFDSSLFLDTVPTNGKSCMSCPRKRDSDVIDFMKMVFLLRDNSDIIRFRLCLDEEFSVDPDNLIIAAVRHNVQEIELDIDVSLNYLYELPRQIFSCKSLRKLKSKSGYDVWLPQFNIPKSVSLHHLNSLIVDGFAIPSIESFRSLCSSCPLLELRIIHCTIGNAKSNLTIDSVYLQTLELHYVHVPAGSIINLNAPNIKSFICKAEMSQEYSFENISSLVTADITMSLEGDEEEDEPADSYLDLSREQNDMYGKRVMEFLRAINNVKDLKLSSGFLEVLSKAPGLLDCKPPEFCNLQYLELNVWFTKGCMQATIYLFNISPNIKSIVLALKESGLPDIEDDWEAGSSLPCILSKLRYVEMRAVEGCDNELKLLGFLLESAVVLEEVALFFCSTLGSSERVGQVKRFRDRLRALPRASPNINIMFFSNCSRFHSDFPA